MNTVWELATRRAGKPLWEFLVNMIREQIVNADYCGILPTCCSPSVPGSTARPEREVP